MDDLPYYLRAQRDAAARVEALLALPDSENEDDFGWFEGLDSTLPARFDPWFLFPAVYGSYSSAFDDCALAVLRRLAEPDYAEEDLAAEMFREMLCALDLCDYGSSPRVCFPTTDFRPLLPRLIEKWETYRRVKWGDE